MERLGIQLEGIDHALSGENLAHQHQAHKENMDHSHPLPKQFKEDRVWENLHCIQHCNRMLPSQIFDNIGVKRQNLWQDVIITRCHSDRMLSL